MNNFFENNNEFNRSYLASLESNPFLPVFWIDLNGFIFKVNNAACAYLGYSHEELTSMNIRQLDAGNTPESMSQLVQTIREKKVHRFETLHRRKDGSLIDVEIISNHHTIDGIEFSFSFAFDISEKKKNERALIESNAEMTALTDRLEKMVEEKTAELSAKLKELEISEHVARQNEELFINAFKTSQDAINLNDINNGTYISVNDGFINIMGYTQEEVIGKSSLDLNIWKSPDERKKLVNDVKQYGYCHNFEADFVRKDGTVIHGLMSASIQEYQGKKVLLNVSKDITQIKKLENELKELNSQLRKKVEEEVSVIRRQQEIIFEQKKLADMGMMINAIAHQWRQPLNIIGLRTQDISECYREGLLTDEYVREFEEQQMDTVEYLSSTIDDFRTFFKPDDNVTEFDVTGEIITLLKLIEIQMFAKGIKPLVSYLCQDDHIEKAGIKDFPQCRFNDTLVKGYKGEFKQVIINLVYNSIFAIEEKYKQNRIKDGYIHIKIHRSGKNVVINVEDNGNGIPQDVKPHIFNPYYTTKAEGKGTGMGLYLAKLIIETHMNGTIELKDTEQGADFEITLPSVK